MSKSMDEVLDFLRGHRLTILVADHVGDVMDDMDEIEEILGIDRTACIMCAGTGIWNGRKCSEASEDCPEGTCDGHGWEDMY